MKTIDETINLNNKELDALCTKYLDCELSQKEEMTLVRILSNRYNLSRIQKEVVFLSCISKVASGTENCNQKFERINIRKAIRKIISYSVASVACIGILAAGWSSFIKESHEPEIVCEVYINGKKVDDEKLSRELAFKSYNESMARIARVKAMEQKHIEEMRIVNERLSEITNENIH